MLNVTIVEGFIATGPNSSGLWQFKRDTLFRLAVVRDPFRPAKPNTNGNDEPDFITVRLPADKFAGLPFTLDKTKRIRVQGFLQSREYQETLGTFLSRAQGMTNLVTVSEDAARQITHQRVTTEMVAEQIFQIEENGTPQARVYSSTSPSNEAKAAPQFGGKNRRRRGTYGRSGAAQPTSPKPVSAQAAPTAPGVTAPPPGAAEPAAPGH